MTSQEEWRRIAYERSLGAQGRPVGTMTSYNAYKTTYVPRVEATNQFYSDISRSGGASGFRIAPSPSARDHAARGYPSGGSLPIGGASVGGDSGWSEPWPSTEPSSMAILLCILLLTVGVTGIGAGLWDWMMGDPWPLEIWKSAVWLGMRLAATAAVLLFSQLVAICGDIFIAAREVLVFAYPFVAAAAGRLSELTWPWIFGMIIAATLAIAALFWALPRFVGWLPRWARLTGAAAAALGAAVLIGPSWWSLHLQLSRAFLGGLTDGLQTAGIGQFLLI